MAKIKLPQNSHIGRTLKFSFVLALIWGLLVVAGLLYLDKAQPFASKLEFNTEAANARPLEIEVVRPERSVLNPLTEVTVISNKEIQLEQRANLSLQSLGRLEGKYYYIARVSNLTLGNNPITLRFSDSSGQTSEQSLKITKEPFAPPAGFTFVGPWDEAEFTLDGDDLKAIVDKQHRLLEDYVPEDLVDLNEKYGILTYNNAMLRADAAQALKQMLDAMREATGDGTVTVASGYRAYEAQVKTYSSWVRELGEREANNVSARPGHSEHQLGTTVDFVSEPTGWQISSQFGQTPAGLWLAENAEKYGFVIPYNEDQTESGGYKEESWHFRYVGVEE